MKAAKPLTDAIRIALHEAADEGNIKKLRVLATKLVDRACEGDVRAAEIVLERLEGKVQQQVAVEAGDSFVSALQSVALAVAAERRDDDQRLIDITPQAEKGAD